MQAFKINDTEYNLIVVGSGFCGSVIAHLAARDGYRVLVLEKRDHIAGNMYDYRNESGLLIQKYGPHVFHTNNDQVADFLMGIDEWVPFNFSYAVDIQGSCVPAPFGFATIDAIFDAEKAQRIKEKLQQSFPNEDGVSILDLLSVPDEEVHEFATFLYENNYLPYAIKQWQIKPEELSTEIIGRMPVRLSDIEPYFLDKYQMLPKDGFTHLFQMMLQNPNIDVQINTDAFETCVACN